VKIHSVPVCSEVEKMGDRANRLRILLVEDDENDAALVERRLRRDGLAVELQRVDTAEAMRAALAERPWDVVLSDFTMPQFSGLKAFDLLRETARDIPFIFVSGTVGEEVAVRAMKLGAADFLVKADLARLAPAIEREVRERDARAAQVQVERELRAALEAKEEQLRQSQKMEAVGRLAGGVAHDFNNMLSVILCYAEIASAGLPSDDERLGHLWEIRSAGKRAADLTKQLLLFSRHQDVERRVLDLSPLIGGMEKLCRRLLGEDVEFVHRTLESSARVRVRSGHVEQLVMNLAVNARDAMPTGGRLTIETSNVLLRDTTGLGAIPIAPGAYVRISVSDTGTGMDRATQARIFEPFFTTKERGKGTGLGLSTVFGIVQQSEGTIDVISEPGKGTTFHVYLPRVDAAVDATTKNATSLTLRGNETVLVVEDEDGVRGAVRTILRGYGYQVLEARSPDEAISVCDSHSEIRLVLSDIVMPQMSGPELSRLLRAPRPEMRVLFMSGYTDDALTRYPLAADEAFLQKPFTPESLASKLREVLDDAPT
jgi:two-component system, cell cycle sensor histidine kinase and response regulator CckA